MAAPGPPALPKAEDPLVLRRGPSGGLGCHTDHMDYGADTLLCVCIRELSCAKRPPPGRDFGHDDTQSELSGAGITLTFQTQKLKLLPLSALHCDGPGRVGSLPLDPVSYFQSRWRDCRPGRVRGSPDSEFKTFALCPG